MDFIDVEVLRRLSRVAYPITLAELFESFGDPVADQQADLKHALARLKARELINSDSDSYWLTLAGRIVARRLLPAAS